MLRSTGMALFASVFGLLAGLGTAEAQIIVPLGPEVPVSVAPGYQPSVAIQQDGTSLVAWLDRPLVVGSIRGQRFDADGAPVGSAFTITEPNEGAGQLRIRADPRGSRFLVAWLAVGFEAAPILARSVGEDGGLGSVFRIDSGAGVQGGVFDVALGEDGTSLAIWSGSAPGPEGVFGQRFSIDGSLLGPMLQLSSPDRPADSPPSTLAVTSGPNERFSVLWTERVGSSGYGQLLLRQVIDGAPAGVNPRVLYQERYLAAEPQFVSPSVPIWSARDGQETAIFLSLLDSASPLNALKLLGSSRMLLHRPQGAVNDSDQSMYLWSSDRETTNDATDLWAQANPRGPAVRVNALARGEQLSPMLAGGRDDTFVAVWEDRPDRFIPEDWRVVMRRFRVVDTPLCGQDLTTACLRDGRFAASVAWENFSGETGQGEVIPFSSSTSALFSFFTRDNWEMQVKVIDGCTNNGHFWVFGAASTNVAYTVTVTDLVTGAEARYENALGTASPAINDTRAFVCP